MDAYRTGTLAEADREAIAGQNAFFEAMFSDAEVYSAGAEVRGMWSRPEEVMARPTIRDKVKEASLGENSEVPEILSREELETLLG